MPHAILVSAFHQWCYQLAAPLTIACIKPLMWQQPCCCRYSCLDFLLWLVHKWAWCLSTSFCDSKSGYCSKQKWHRKGTVGLLQPSAPRQTLEGHPKWNDLTWSPFVWGGRPRWWLLGNLWNCSCFPPECIGNSLTLGHETTKSRCKTFRCRSVRLRPVAISWRHSIIVCERDVEETHGSSEVQLCSSVENCNPPKSTSMAGQCRQSCGCKVKLQMFCIQMLQVGPAEEITTLLLSMAAQKDEFLLKVLQPIPTEWWCPLPFSKHWLYHLLYI